MLEETRRVETTAAEDQFCKINKVMQIAENWKLKFQLHVYMREMRK